MKIAVDLDGTIITCKERQIGLLICLAKANGIALNADEVWQYKRNGLNTHDALFESGMDEIEAGALCRQWATTIETFPWLDFDRCIPGAVGALKKLRLHGNTMHLVSARVNGKGARVQLRHLGIEKLFDTVDFVHPATQRGKAAVFRELRPEWYVGDTEKDCEQARVAGVSVALVSCGMRSKDFLLRETGVEAWSTLADIPLEEFI